MDSSGFHAVGVMAAIQGMTAPAWEVTRKAFVRFGGLWGSVMHLLDSPVVYIERMVSFDGGHKGHDGTCMGGKAIAWWAVWHWIRTLAMWHGIRMLGQ